MNGNADSFACPGFRHAAVSRRSVLQVGGLGALGLSLPALLRAADQRKGPPPQVRSVIFLFQFGGPSHVDMFDRKPDAPDDIRGPLGSIQTTLPGLAICEHLPRTADIMNKLTVIRTMTHKSKNHNSATYCALTGHEPPSDDQRLRDSLDLFPAYGSVVDKVAPGAKDMPTFVAYPHVMRDGSISPGQTASFLGKRHDPLLFTEDPNDDDFQLPELSLPEGLSPDRLANRRKLQQIVDRQSRLLDHSATARGLDAYYEKALSMLTSDKVRRAFDLSAEPEQVRESYGRTTYGQSCLLARRLVEAGVKFVNVYFSRNIGGQSTASGGWDTHGFNNTRMFPIVKDYHFPVTEQTLPTLILDLEARGLLDETLVVRVGEFGRTPKINNNASRDHWPNCYSALLAGGGIRRGYVHGASDKYAMFPARDPVRPGDLAATIFYLLGIDPGTEIHDTQDRPLVIADGRPVIKVLA